MSLQKIIVDEDGGGDTMQVLAVLLAHPELFRILGLTSIEGNGSGSASLMNNGRLLNLLGAGHIPYYPGIERSAQDRQLDKDFAHGKDGTGKITLPETPYPPQQQLAVDFILDGLKADDADSITLIAAGPLTNIAAAFRKDPVSMRRVKQIVIMGGCTKPMAAADRDFRQGNMTPQAEFNFNQAAEDAQTLMQSGLPITLFPMNCTHQMTLTPERQGKIRAALSNDNALADILIGLMTAPAKMDMDKFASSPVMHDIHTVLNLIYPQHYQGHRGFVDVTVCENRKDEMNGHTRFRPDEKGNVMVMERILDPDALFNHMVDCFIKCLAQPGPPAPLAPPAAALQA